MVSWPPAPTPRSWLAASAARSATAGLNVTMWRPAMGRDAANGWAAGGSCGRHWPTGPTDRPRLRTAWEQGGDAIQSWRFQKDEFLNETPETATAQEVAPAMSHRYERLPRRARESTTELIAHPGTGAEARACSRFSGARTRSIGCQSRRARSPHRHAGKAGGDEWLDWAVPCGVAASAMRRVAKPCRGPTPGCVSRLAHDLFDQQRVPRK